MFRFIYQGGGKIGRGRSGGTKTKHLPLFAIERKLIHLLERKEPSIKLEIACDLSERRVNRTENSGTEKMVAVNVRRNGQAIFFLLNEAISGVCPQGV